MSAPFVWIFVCFAAGVLSAEFIQFSEWLLLPAAFAALLGLHCSKFRIAITAQAFLLLLIGSVFARHQIELYARNPLREWVRSHEREVVAFAGTLIRTPELSEEYFVLHVRVESVSGILCEGNARLTVTGELKEPWIAGDRIQSFARLRLGKNFRTEGAFDYERHLRAEGIHVLGTIKSPLLIHGQGAEAGFRRFTSGVRLRWIQNTIQTFSASNSGILRALWLDDRGGLRPAEERVLMDAGVFHVIAISGFHISVLLLLLFLGFKRLLSFRCAVAAACLFMLGYFLILEGRSSVTRSFLSFLIFSFAIWRYEQIQLGNWICLSAFVQVAINPQELFDSGFHLTYLSTGAILFLVVPLCKRLNRLSRWIRYPLNFLVAGIIIQIVLIPYQIYVFHRVPLYTLFANIVAVPVSSVLIASSIVLMPLPFLSKFVRTPVQGMIHIFLSSSGIFAEQGVRMFTSPHLAAVFGFYGLLVIGIVAKRNALKITCFAISASLLLFFLTPHSAKPGGALQVHFLDVGQGDAILLEYPDGTYDMVDGGGFFNAGALDTGQAILMPYLCRLGVTRLHRVFLTHAHADHMNGLVSLMRYIPVDEFYVTREPVGEKGYQQFLRNINRAPIRISQGHEFKQAGVLLRVLAPGDSNRTLRVKNDDSLVLLVEYRNKKILLTGDIEMEGEEILSGKIQSPVDYVKVPHHGSKSSSSVPLLEALRPRAGFISVGSNNWFGHPNPNVLGRYRRYHVLLYRTDLHGTIRLRISDHESRVYIPG
ncbi:DNA internalization-related competence protein ComEC/Rec2 [bacterium]|nr:DNA internalization-related competence protein ComEC/Rec2 [bacterium]